MKSRPAPRRQGPTGDGTRVASGQRGEPGGLVVPPRHSLQRKWHVVEAGENLIRISKRYYGEGARWRLIQKANPDTVGPNGEVGQGKRIVIPELEREQAPGASRPVRAGSGDQAATRAGTITVKPGQTLSELALTYLGSSGLARQLFEANRDVLDDPDDVNPGDVLRLPKPERIVRPSAKKKPAPDGDSQTYTVKSGETLSSIAQKVLGKSSQWRRLYNANRGQLDSPHSVPPGMKLTIPKDGV